MSRPILAALVAILITVLTAAVYFVTTSNLETRVRGQVRDRVTSAQNLLSKQYTFEALSRRKTAESLARDPQIVRALEGPNAALGTARLRAFRADVDNKPDVLALMNKKGEVMSLLSGDSDVDILPNIYLEKGKPIYPAITEALKSPVNRRQLISEVWNYKRIGPMKVAIAPVVDSDFGEIEGAVVVAYSFSAEAAAEEKRLLGADVGYFFGKEVYATSFVGGTAQALSKPLFTGGLADAALDNPNGYSDMESFEIDGEEFIGTAMRLGSFPTQAQDLPKDYPKGQAGALVLASVSRAMAPVSNVKLAILLLGLGAILVSLIAMAATAKSILGPLDEIEVGINEIINGNLDKTFNPSGSDLDGLANGLNVMLARLLGRPEPGDEEFDEDGNIIRGSNLDFDTEGLSPKDAEAMKLAQEPEDTYFKRLFEEYISARKAAGVSNDGITEDNFSAKLRLNEATLREKYKCKSVRFKVVAKGDKVTLKPVPIV